MNPRDGGRSEPLYPNLLQGFAISYGLWAVPVLLRWSLGLLPGASVALEAAGSLLLHGIVLATIGVVYRAAIRRGASMTVATALSLIAMIPAMTLYLGCEYLLGQWDASLQYPGAAPPPGVGQAVLVALVDSLTLCPFLAALIFLPLFARAHEERNNELELARRDAELLRIRAHLEPHFIINSLNAVAGLIEEDSAQARELLAVLGDLLREATSFKSLHRVRDEMAWLQRYIAIHEMRYSGLLHPELDVDPVTLDLFCPALILQPLVENAIKHGALRGAGYLAVRVAIEDGRLLLTVEDDGPELLPERVDGRGLQIVRRRLKLEAADAAELELGRESGHTTARVRLPLNRAGES